MYKIGLFNDSFPPFIDGVSNAVLNYAKILQKKYCDIVVITPRYPNVVDDYAFEVYRYQSLKFKGDMPYRVGNPFSLLAISEIRRKRLDLVHVHSPFASSVIANSASIIRSKRIPVVLTYHTRYEIDLDRYVGKRLFKLIAHRFVSKNINRADEVWVVSKGSIASLRSFGYKGSIRLMPNGTDFVKGKAPIEHIRVVDRMYETADEENVFLYCGRMLWYKNLKIIIDALKTVKETGIKFKMLMVGDGPDRALIEQYSHRQGLDDCIIFTGAIYDRVKVKAFFSRANLHLFPSTYDTSGLVVIEAAACECASVLVSGSCAAEGIVDGVSGFLCEKENGDSFAKAIIRAISDKEKLIEVGKKAQEELFCSWDDAVANAYARYEEIIDEFHKKGRRRFRKSQRACNDKL